MQELLSAIHTDGVHVTGFRPHPAILRWIMNSGRILVGGHQFHEVIDARDTGDPTRIVYEGDIKHDHGWVHLSAEVETGSPRVRFTGSKIYGDETYSDPTLPRLTTHINLTKFDGAKTEGILILDELRASARTYNGQGTTIVAADVDFAEQTITRLPGIPRHGIWSGRYVPRYATQTGGKWAYMGPHHNLTAKTEEEWMAALYAMLSYPGFFLNDDGSFMEEREWPDRVVGAGGHWHQKARDKGFINYKGTLPNGKPAEAPWDWETGLQQDGEEMRFGDSQHMTATSSVAAEACLRWPRNEGFRRIVLAIAARFPLQVNDHGPRSKHEVDRGSARPLMLAIDLWRALQRQGDTYALGLSVPLAARAGFVLRSVLDLFKANPDWPWDDFGSEGWAATGEAGLVWWALHQVLELYDDIGLPAGEGWRGEIIQAREITERFCFESFMELADGFGVPYRRHRDGRHSDETSSSTHFVWQAAARYTHPPSEARRKAKILEMGAGVEPKWKVVA